MRKIFTFIFFLLIISTVEAQFNQGIYSFRNLPLNRLYNPSADFKNDKEILVPIVSHIQIQSAFYGINIQEVFSSGPTANQTIEKFISTKNGNEHIWVDEMLNLFYYGFKDKTETKFWSFGMYQQVQGYSFYPADIIDVAYYGNRLDEIYKAEDLRTKALAMTVYHAGLTFKPKNKSYTLGGRIKLYNALGAVDAVDNKGTIATVKDPNTNQERIYFDAKIRANSSGFNSYSENTTSQLIKNSIFSGNLGLGFDIGATQQIDENWSASISVIDIGAIYFTQDISNYQLTGYHEFEGAIIVDPTDPNDDFWDEMINNFNSDIESGTNEKNFVYNIPPEIIGSVTYEIKGKKKRSKKYMSSCSYDSEGMVVNSHYFTFTSYNKLLRRYWDWALGVSYMGELTPWFAVQANYLFSPYDKTNFGMGVSFRFDPILLYFSVDNIPGLTDLNTTSSAGAFMGINIVL